MGLGLVITGVVLGQLFSVLWSVFYSFLCFVMTSPTPFGLTFVGYLISSLIPFSFGGEVDSSGDLCVSIPIAYESIVDGVVLQFGLHSIRVGDSLVVFI